MEHCMKEVLVRTKPKDSFTLIVSGSSANIQPAFSPPLHLQTNRDYELAMVIWKRVIHLQIFEKATIRSNGVLIRARVGQFSAYQLDVMN